MDDDEICWVCAGIFIFIVATYLLATYLTWIILVIIIIGVIVVIFKIIKSRSNTDVEIINTSTNTDLSLEFAQFSDAQSINGIPEYAACLYCKCNIRETFYDNDCGGCVKCLNCNAYYHKNCLREINNICSSTSCKNRRY